MKHPTSAVHPLPPECRLQAGYWEGCSAAAWSLSRIYRGYLSERCLARSSGVGRGQRLASRSPAALPCPALPCPAAPHPFTLVSGCMEGSHPGWELSHSSAPEGGVTQRYFSALAALPVPPLALAELPALAKEEAASDSVCKESLGGCRGFLWL